MEVPEFPLLATSRIASPNFGQDDALAVTDRNAIGSFDACTLQGLGSGGHMDDTPASGFLARSVVNQAILDANANGTHYLFTYMNMMETADNGSSKADYLDAVDGPGSYDGWTRDSAGVKVSFFGTSFGVNLSNYVAVDGDGDRYAEWYADNIVEPDYVDVMTAASVPVGGAGGCNIFIDNYQLHANKSGVDWDNNVGGNDDAQDYYDPEDAAHVAADPIAVIAYSGWRENHRKGKNRVITNNPTMVVLPNTNQWSEEHSGAIGDLRDVILEYRLDGQTEKADVHGGFSENNMNRNFPRSGVSYSGVNNGTSGSMERSYNNAHQSYRFAQDPKIVFFAWGFECLQSSSTPAGGHAIWPNIPASNAKWNAYRWTHGATLMGNCHYSVGGIQVGTSTSGRAKSTPLFDEMGLINTGTTGLSRKWMGAAVDDIQVAARETTIWWREFENALVIVNFDNDEANSDATVTFADLPGDNTTWKRINGSQDSTWNDNSNVTANFDIPPIDGIILERR